MLLQGDPCGVAVWATVVFAPFIGRLQGSFAVAMHAPDGTRCTAALPVMLTLCIALPYKTQTNWAADSQVGPVSALAFARFRAASALVGRGVAGGVGGGGTPPSSQRAGGGGVRGFLGWCIGVDAIGSAGAGAACAVTT